MSYKNYNWEIVANDYNSPLFRNYIWVKSFYYYPQVNKTDRVVLGIISKEDNVEYIADLSSWNKVHQQLKALALKDNDYVDDLISRAHQEGQKFNDWTAKEIFNADLSKKSGKELYDLLDKFDQWQGKMYAIGTALPILDFQDFAFVENFLRDYLKSKLGEEEFKDYYTVFTEPPANSFAQDQEEDLLNIMARYWDVANWRDNVKNKSLKELEKLHPDFYNDLVKHTEKHCWVYYVYNGPESTTEDFLGFARDYLLKLEHPDKLLKEISKQRDKVAKKKEEFIKKYQPTDFEKKMLDLAAKFVWGKPRRKDYQSKSYYHAKKLQLEIAKRLNLSLAQMRSTPFDMIRRALINQQAVDIKIINSIKKFHIVLPNDDGSVSILYGQEAEKFDSQINRKKAADYKDLKKVEGSVAYAGNAQGTVKIVNVPSDMNKMAEGDILISVNTTPNIVAAMKRAAAIVTDEGGLTCHAAIVSRELKTPCVVGTKIATQVFKDGDKVKVDADKGIITKID